MRSTLLPDFQHSSDSTWNYAQNDGASRHNFKSPFHLVDKDSWSAMECTKTVIVVEFFLSIRIAEQLRKERNLLKRANMSAITSRSR